MGMQSACYSNMREIFFYRWCTCPQIRICPKSGCGRGHGRIELRGAHTCGRQIQSTGRCGEWRASTAWIGRGDSSPHTQYEPGPGVS